MPKIFLSAAEADAAFAEKLRKQLRRAVSTVHMGQALARERLAGAIEDWDGLALVWSPAAAACPRVADEWAKALVLGKTICVAMLETADLPAELQAVPVHPVKPMTGLARWIVKTLWDGQKELGQDAGEPKPNRSKPEKPALTRWYYWVTGLAGLLTIVALSFDIPAKINKAYPSNHLAKPVSQQIAGTIFDDAGEPLGDVTVTMTLDGQRLETKTDQKGWYSFDFKSVPDRQARLMVQRADYQTDWRDVAAGNANNNFTMRRKGRE